MPWVGGRGGCTAGVRGRQPPRDGGEHLRFLVPFGPFCFLLVFPWFGGFLVSLVVLGSSGGSIAKSTFFFLKVERAHVPKKLLTGNGRQFKLITKQALFEY